MNYTHAHTEAATQGDEGCQLVVPGKRCIDNYADAQRELLFGKQEYLSIRQLAGVFVVKVTLLS